MLMFHFSYLITISQVKKKKTVRALKRQHIHLRFQALPSFSDSIHTTFETNKNRNQQKMK